MGTPKHYQDQIEQQIKDAKTLLSELEKLAEQQRQENQHHEIDHLEDYIQGAEPHWKDLKLFYQDVVNDLSHLHTSIHDMIDRIVHHKPTRK